jgi:two-component system, NtrC family, sensor kinase
MAKRKNPVRTPVKRDSASTARKRASVDVDLKGENSRLSRELKEALERQKAVAIENTRLLKELGQHTNDLSESREQQTAISDVLRVISSSPGDVQPVLAAVAKHSARICEAQIVDILTVKDGKLHYAAELGDFGRILYGETAPLNRDTVMGRSVCDKQPIHVIDLQSMDHDFPLGREYALALGHRTTLAVPLIREDTALGTILVRRAEVRPFDNRHIALLKTFADQAAIAIENTRLLNETEEALERQTATADILKVIASSPSDVQPVFEAIAERSNRLIDGLSTAVYSIVDDTMQLVAFTRTSREADAALQASFPLPLSQAFSGDQIRRGEIVEIRDVGAEWAGQPAWLQLARLRGFRSLLFVPLLRDEATIGVISVTRSEAGSFAPHHVQLLRTFADQAVIAIENVRMFEQVQQRTKELSQSLDDLRTAQDRLVQTQKLASLGQLTAGIAHEIKNPLNFVNNFSALSAELVGEMNDVLAGATLDEKTRGELDELTYMLKSNLEKVVQHGKRADSIVKNMLQHSREGSGEHRPADINAVVDESLNLAYHGARAEKAGFTITLERKFDPAVGMVDVYPQEITRALLNLISNGFYATAKRKAEAGDGFEPMLSATTTNLGDKVEIRIRDNGTGIPEEVKEKVFNPFFTTKPSGEGTGLGLSMSHDIIVKQHGGSIDLETKSGLFTEFKIVLPRTSKR